MPKVITRQEHDRRVKAYFNNLTIKQMGEEIGLSTACFRAWMESRGFPAKSRRGRSKTKVKGESSLTLKFILNSPKRTARMKRFISSRPEWERLRMAHFAEKLELIISRISGEMPKGAGSRFVEQYRIEYGRRGK